MGYYSPNSPALVGVVGWQSGGSPIIPRVSKATLLDNVLYWYISPAMFLLYLFILGQGITGRLPIIMKMGVFIAATSVGTYFLNKRAVKKQLIPRLEKIDKLIN